ncbi:UvrD-helicase domain-containing protein [Tessaracoccus caeni]|uniref:UvrD-helicase domain-containing protein n=1 Tax=Tessaracoccus caeni TaxID=3031239 RepID=UPI0023D9ACF9|nr:UvrD-helicase domain-containing protein [Tessaracoccus caeni]MDF1486793.1 UvrD-helicase domain-containing protein [Tessaracoccus caeni]
MRAFDLSAPLPRSTVVLEASAGTGKTYTIAALTCRYVAEHGHEIGDLLLITFGNAASNELRDRVFAALAQAEHDLGAFLADGRLPDDEVARQLCSADAPLRHRRLRAAVEGFDEATIVTTHAFCQAMLRSLGILGDHDPSEQLLPDARRLIEQCTADQYLQDFAGGTVDQEHLPLPARTAMDIGREACLRQIPLHPADSSQARFGESVRRRFAARKLELGVVTYDDLITRLRDALLDPVSGRAAIQVLRDRYAVVLVDEFQDTDPQQWSIIETAFVADDRPTILVGDPKQSIYGFRNADVLSYLEATSKADKLSLTRNYRSDQALIDGVEELFGNLRLGDPRIVVEPVHTRQPGSRLRLPDAEARVWIRGSTADQLTADPDDAIAEDLVGQVRRLLAGGRIEDPNAQEGSRPVRLHDIVVLTRRGRRAEELCRRLIDTGHPATLMGQRSVWQQEAAAEWLTLLRAMAEPGVAANRKAALTALIGAHLAALADDSSPASAEASALIRELARDFADGGIAAAFTTLRLRTRLDSRLLAEAGGERRLTDLVHVAELLGAQDSGGLTALTAWLEGKISAPGESDEPIRAEDDADAVRVMTMHSAKGLEFPIVLLPEVSRTLTITYRPFPLIDGDRRVLYVGPRPTRNSRVETELTRQLRDEELRLLYVGLTRAKHLAIAWHVDDGTSATSPMSALLYRDPTSPELGPRYAPGKGNIAFDRQRVLLSRLDPAPQPRQAPPVSGSEPPSPRTFIRRVDATWRRTSYTGLTQALHDAPIEAGDEPASLEALPVDPSLAVLSPMTGLPSGAAFGTLVHAALERLDWSPATLAQDATRVATELGSRFGLDAPRCAILANALEALCRTPLSPLTEATLSRLGTAARLAELDFDLPLADKGRPATVGQLATLMERHLDATDPLAAYPGRLSATEAADGVLNGFLTGSIDAVLRTPEGRFLVVDYKTNNLSPSPDVPQTLGHYTSRAMAEAMMQAHYPLQALLYCAALHRYLGLRLPGYDPHRHLGGVGYLFVRGMAGPETPVVDGARCGVFSWYPSPELVVATSDLLGGQA